MATRVSTRPPHRNKHAEVRERETRSWSDLYGRAKSAGEVADRRMGTTEAWSTRLETKRAKRTYLGTAAKSCHTIHIYKLPSSPDHQFVYSLCNSLAIVVNWILLVPS